MDLLIEMMAVGSSQAIENQEKRGQEELIKLEILPVNILDNGQEVLEQAGVTFLGIVPEDPIFQHVKLPTGWSKYMTDTNMWTELLDERGRVRGTIFYKNTNYDRSAHMNLECRFSVRRDYHRQSQDHVAITHVLDSKKVIHTTEPVELPENRHEQYVIAQQADKMAVQWLDRHYPDWYNPASYWSD